MSGRERTGSIIAVFAKAPVPGDVKTRLIPALGAEGAAALHRALVQRALATALESRVGPVQLWCAPDTARPFFAECGRRFGVQLVQQRDGDLGLRMQHAFECLLSAAERALLIGSDVPALTPDYLRAADETLAQGMDAVLGPAEDGGYVLIGLRRVVPEVFAHIDWGEAEVLATTRGRFAHLGWRHAELATLWDVDRPEDLEREDVRELVASIRHDRLKRPRSPPE